MPLFYADASALVKLVRDRPAALLDRALLLAAGAFAEPALRALDAIHVAAALELSPVDTFVSYDDTRTPSTSRTQMRHRSVAPWA